MVAGSCCQNVSHGRPRLRTRLLRRSPTRPCIIIIASLGLPSALPGSLHESIQPRRAALYRPICAVYAALWLTIGVIPSNGIAPFTFWPKTGPFHTWRGWRALTELQVIARVAPCAACVHRASGSTHPCALYARRLVRCPGPGCRLTAAAGWGWKSTFELLVRAGSACCHSPPQGCLPKSLLRCRVCAATGEHHGPELLLLMMALQSRSGPRSIESGLVKRST